MRFSTCVLISSLLSLAGLSTQVDAHAKLVQPAPWNARPSQAAVCGLAGNAAMVNPKPSLVDPAALVMNVQWAVVIGDGAGKLSASIDTTGKLKPAAADFNVQLTQVGNLIPSAVSQTPYNIMFTMPKGLTCTGPGGTCTLRVRSTSNWVACATFKFQAGVAGAAPPAGAGAGPVAVGGGVTVTRATAKPTVKAATPTPTVKATTKPPTQPPTTPDQTTPETTTPTDNTDNTDDDTTTPTTTPSQPTSSQPTPYILDPSLTDLTIAPEDVSGLYGYILDPRSPIYSTSAALDNQCVTPTTLKTCSSVNGQSVQLLGPDANNVDLQALDEINFAMSSTTMFERPNTPGCRQAYVDLMCAQMFPPCQAKGTVVCTSSCTRVNNLCKPNATAIIDSAGKTSTHASLYDCANRDLGFTELNADSTGNCPAVATGVRPMNSATSVSSSSSSTTTIVFALVTSLLALVARV